MNATVHATEALGGVRQQHAAELSTLVAHLNAEPAEVGPVTEAFLRILDIAAGCPGGQQALVDGLTQCSRVVEVLAFCKSFVNVIAIDCGMARHPFGAGFIQPVHDMEVTP